MPATSMSPSVLAEIGTANLERVLAIDSQSRDASPTIPSSEGQVRLAEDLEAYFGGLGLATRRDAHANVIVTVPAARGFEEAPTLALMVHMDTAEGTQAVPRLERVPAWDGGQVTYPANDRLHVSVADYPELAAFVGEDLLHGPGAAPIGLDDKLGMAQLMTLARLLVEEPALPHGALLLVFRPDEEIGRMEAVRGLAAELAAAGVRYGYTVDGIARFEVNVENFHAARVRVAFAGAPLPRRAPTEEERQMAEASGEPREPHEGRRAREVTFRVDGVKSHGATARAEGYRNATVLVTRALAALEGRADIVPVRWRAEPGTETNAEVTFLLAGGENEELHALRDALELEVAPHRRRGADVALIHDHVVDADRASWHDGLARALRHLARFLRESTVAPLLSEESAGRQGYTNPYAIAADGGRWCVDYRVRDFDAEGLQRRVDELQALAGQAPRAFGVEVHPQYVNMGPALAPYPELARWAEEAGAQVGVAVERGPIRGGTGVDPFLDAGIPVANVGTGYFAPESEKELTSRQSLAQHVLWLAALVRRVAEDAAA